MKLTFASLNRTFRALASLEREGVVHRVTFDEHPYLELHPETFKELFPDVEPVNREFGDFYRVAIGDLEVTAWDVN